MMAVGGRLAMPDSSLPDWFYVLTKGFADVKIGAECCAPPDSVSFPYKRKPAFAQHLFSLLYDSNCRGDSTLNKKM